MIEAPFALAFGAGLVATLNPCGFAMLPAYLSYFMGLSDDDEDTSRAAALWRALVIGAVMAAAFLVVFGVTGLAITAGFRAVIDWIPWIALGIGALIAVLGIAMLFGFELTVALPKAKSAGKGRGLRSVFGFGLSYGVASLSCTLPVFLSVVATQLTAASFVSGVATFIVYGLGMSMMLIGVTLVLAFGKQAIVGKLRASARYINRISGAVLLIAGAYIVWFWGTNIGRGAEALGDSGAFRFTETLSQRATELIGENALQWGLFLGGLIAAVVGYTFYKRRFPSSGGGSPRTRLLVRLAGLALIAGVGAGVVFTAGDGAGGTAMASTSGPRGPQVPTATFNRFSGESVSLADYQGRPVVVNFWASWCPSCVAELSAAIRPAQERFGDQVDFVGVNLQDERSRALQLVDDTGVRFDLVEDPIGTLYRQFDALAMPFTVFVSADGEVLDEHNGPLTEGQLTGKIEELFLGGGEPTPVVVPEEPADTPVEDTPSVIVEADPDVPSRLARLQGWETNWGRRTIDLEELILGIPSSDPRDAIPPLDDPEFETVADAAQWLDGREPGILFTVGDDVRFFPLRILTFHEVVNVDVGGKPVVVTFCPLCNTAVAFDPTVDGQLLRFGVSGLLRFSDLVMWDSATNSLWQQITGEGIVGDFAGTQLELLPSSVVNWQEFSTSFPEGLVLSRQTGYSRSYGQNPYVGYSSSTRPFLFDGEVDERFPALERVVGVTVESADKAYPFSVISGPGAVNDTVGGVPIVVLWGSDTADALDSRDIAEGEAIGTAVAFDRRIDGVALSFVPNGNETFRDEETGTVWDLLGRGVSGPLAGEQLNLIVHRNDFWFAWAAFHPGDPVYGG